MASGARGIATAAAACLAPIVLTAGCIGCGGPEMERVWVNPEKPPSYIFRDREACLEEAGPQRRAAREGPYLAAVDATVAYHECMARLGWVEEERPVPEQ